MTKVIRIKDKKWVLPSIVMFENYTLIGEHYTCDVVDFRCPLFGEFYLSGAEPKAWQAPNDMSSPFLVVTKKTRMVQRQTWVPFDKQPKEEETTYEYISPR